MLIPTPAALTALAFDIATEAFVAEGIMVICTCPATPEAMTFVFNPVSRQVDEPAADTQLIVLPPAVAAGPGVTENIEI
jgi:hypothetical protein